MAEIDDDPPPLEDMTEFLEQVKKFSIQEESPKMCQCTKSTHIKPAASQRSSSQRSSTKTTKNAAVQVGKPVTVKSHSNSTDNKSFGGMKRGFLFSSVKSKSRQKHEKTQTISNDVIESSESDDLRVLEPKNEPQHQIPEVQEAMMSSAPSWLENKSWITGDLLSSIEKHPELAKQIQQPKFAKAVAKFQSNPQQAMISFQSDPELQEFFREFFSVLGDHFTKLGDTQKAPSNPEAVHCGGSAIQIHDDSQAADMTVRSSTDPHQSTEEDDMRMKKILADPKIQEVLADTRIQRLIEMLRKEPHKVQGLLQRASADLKPKVQRLVDSGLLAYTP